MLIGPVYSLNPTSDPEVRKLPPQPTSEHLAHETLVEARAACYLKAFSLSIFLKHHQAITVC